MGPTDAFLDWSQHVTGKAEQFFIEFFNNLEEISKFEQLSSKGFEALKTIIYDVNISMGNLKLIKRTKNIAIQSDNTSSNKNTGSTQTQGPVYGPTEKP